MFPFGLITRTQRLSNSWKHLRNSFSWFCPAKPDIQHESPRHPRILLALNWIFISWSAITLEWNCVPFLQSLAPGKSLFYLVVIRQTGHKFCGSPFGSVYCYRIFLLCPLRSLSTSSKHNDLRNCLAYILRLIERIKHTHTRVCVCVCVCVGGGWQFCCDQLRYLTVHIGSFGIL
jgi:hypothetical protein